jgi:hypothetical protein
LRTVGCGFIPGISVEINGQSIPPNLPFVLIQFTKNEAAGNTVDPLAKRKLINGKLVSLHPVNLFNYLYMNIGNCNSSNESAAAGINERSVSNGAVYADFINDGDLDAVVNIINMPAFVFFNNISKPARAEKHSAVLY